MSAVISKPIAMLAKLGAELMRRLGGTGAKDAAKACAAVPPMPTISRACRFVSVDYAFCFTVSPAVQAGP